MPNTQLIKIQLIKKNMTVTDLAESLGMELTACSKMINGAKPYYAYQEKAAEVLGVDLDRVFPKRERRRAAS